MYKTSGSVVSASEFLCVVYAKALENVFSDTTSCEETISRVLGTEMR